jgi:hypothetical protein
MDAPPTIIHLPVFILLFLLSPESLPVIFDSESDHLTASSLYTHLTTIPIQRAMIRFAKRESTVWQCIIDIRSVPHDHPHTTGNDPACERYPQRIIIEIPNPCYGILFSRIVRPAKAHNRDS